MLIAFFPFLNDLSKSGHGLWIWMVCDSDH
jgi:hypothetical protein